MPDLLGTIFVLTYLIFLFRLYDPNTFSIAVIVVGIVRWPECHVVASEDCRTIIWRACAAYMTKRIKHVDPLEPNHFTYVNNCNFNGHTIIILQTVLNWFSSMPSVSIRCMSSREKNENGYFIVPIRTLRFMSMGRHRSIDWEKMITLQCILTLQCVAITTFLN